MKKNAKSFSECGTKIAWENIGSLHCSFKQSDGK